MRWQFWDFRPSFLEATIIVFFWIHSRYRLSYLVKPRIGCVEFPMRPVSVWLMSLLPYAALCMVCVGMSTCWTGPFHEVSLMTWSKVRPWSNESKCLHNAAVYFYNPNSPTPLWENQHFHVHKAAFSGILCQDEGFRTLGRNRGTHWKSSHTCARPWQFLGNTTKPNLKTVDRNGVFNYFMGHNMLLYDNKNLRPQRVERLSLVEKIWDESLLYMGFEPDLEKQVGFAQVEWRNKHFREKAEFTEVFIPIISFILPLDPEM